MVFAFLIIAIQQIIRNEISEVIHRKFVPIFQICNGVVAYDAGSDAPGCN